MQWIRITITICYSLHISARRKIPHQNCFYIPFMNITVALWLSPSWLWQVCFRETSFLLYWNNSTCRVYFNIKFWKICIEHKFFLSSQWISRLRKFLCWERENWIEKSRFFFFPFCFFQFYTINWLL